MNKKESNIHINICIDENCRKFGGTQKCILQTKDSKLAFVSFPNIRHSAIQKKFNNETPGEWENLGGAFISIRPHEKTYTIRGYSMDLGPIQMRLDELISRLNNNYPGWEFKYE